MRWVYPSSAHIRQRNADKRVRNCRKWFLAYTRRFFELVRFENIFSEIDVRDDVFRLYEPLHIYVKNRLLDIAKMARL